MPLVQLYKGRRQHRRSRKLKGRKEWQDVLPTTREGRQAYKIADKYQSRFSRAFTEANKNRFDIRGLKTKFKQAWKTGSIIEIMNTLPLYQEGISQEDDPVWAKFFARMSSAYTDVVQAAGTEATKDLNRALGTNLGFAVENEEPEGPEIVEKAKKKKKPKGPFPPRPNAPVVPVNPYSKAWIKEHVLELVKEGVAPEEFKVVQNILIDGFSEGIRAEEALDIIEANIGLTEREYKAVRNFQDRMMQRLIKEKVAPGKMTLDEASREAEHRAVKYTEKLTKKRAIRIARTETIKAQAQGRSDSWRVAIEEGSLSTEVVRKWMTPPPSPNPGRPCAICLELDGKTAPVGGVYESAFVGSLDGPPAHPHCLSGNTTVTARGVTAVSKRRYDGDVIIFRTARGYGFTCTPNHPILTDAGWVSAASLAVGDHVVSDRGFERISAPLIDKEHEHVPAVVDTIANLFEQLSFSETVPVPGTAEDFHGDGTDGEVTVVRTNSTLGDAVNASVLQEQAEFQFLFGSLRKYVLSVVGIFTKFFKRYLLPTSCFIRSLGKLLAVFGFRLGHSKIHRSTTPTWCDACLQKQTSNHVAADVPGFAQRLLTESSDVVLDNIIDVGVQCFAGHVYNLQTLEGYYIAQSVYTHNCRCTETLTREKSDGN